MTTAAAEWGLNKLFTNDNYCLFGYPFDTLALTFPLLRVMLVLMCRITDTTQIIILSLAAMLVELDKYSEAIVKEGGNLLDLLCLKICLTDFFYHKQYKKNNQQ